MTKMMTIAFALSFSTAAIADSHTEKKAPDAAKKAPDAAKKAPDAAKKEEPKKMEAPKAPKEIEDMAKTMAGTWKCTGKVAMNPADPTKMTDFTGTSKSAMATDLDKWWIKGDYTGKFGGMTMKGTMLTTFDATAKKWFRFSADNMGGSDWASAAAATGTKIVWEGESRGMMAGKTRSTEEMVGKDFKMTVEGSADGKKWATSMEMTCKK
ncbi:MAG: DUF1579 family protein [Kofleriaceae bacterium]